MVNSAWRIFGVVINKDLMITDVVIDVSGRGRVSDTEKRSLSICAGNSPYARVIPLSEIASYFGGELTCRTITITGDGFLHMTGGSKKDLTIYLENVNTILPNPSLTIREVVMNNGNAAAYTADFQAYTSTRKFILEPKQLYKVSSYLYCTNFDVTHTGKYYIVRGKNGHRINELPKIDMGAIKRTTHAWDKENVYSITGETLDIYPKRMMSTTLKTYQGSLEKYIDIMTSVTKIHVHNGIAEISEAAFSAPSNDQSFTVSQVIIDDTVEYIGMKAFSCLHKLAQVKLPKNLKKLGSRAFEWCTELKSVMIPPGVKEIQNNTFAWCLRLTTVGTSGIIHKIGSSAFYHCHSLSKITGCGLVDVKEIGGSAFESCHKFAPDLGVLGGCASIGDKAFSKTAVSKVNYNGAELKVGLCAFDNCQYLDEVNLRASSLTIGQAAFKNCTNLKSINIDATKARISGSWLERYTASTAKININKDCNIQWVN